MWGQPRAQEELTGGVRAGADVAADVVGVVGGHLCGRADRVPHNAIAESGCEAFDLGDDFALTPRIQYSHLASQYATPFPSTATYVPGRSLWDARLTLDIGERYKIEGFVQNIGDKTYIASQVQNSSSATGGILYGAPRTYGVRAVVKFGG